MGLYFLLVPFSQKRDIARPMVLIDKALRGDLQFSMVIGVDWQSETLHCYMNFNNSTESWLAIVLCRGSGGYMILKIENRVIRPGFQDNQT